LGCKTKKKDVNVEVMAKHLLTVNVLGVKVASITIEELHHRLYDYVKQDQRALILYANAHALNLTSTHHWLRDFFNRAELVFCDGAGVIFAAKLLGRTIPARITYADWMWQLAQFAAEHSLSLFLLGSKPGIAQKAATRLMERFPGLQIVGTHHGYFDKSVGSADNEAVIQQINVVKPNILIVGFGMPLQEHWLLENRARIDANVVLTGGAVFDYISGELRRGPKWMTENGMEWLARMLVEPRRLWKRYVIGNPLFLWRVCKQRLGILKLPQLPNSPSLDL
jgi:N-acetylglucosaminyldiphosphoundecaprenol N-acetyl-beta-D-mannosaminyltransferase